MRSFAPAAVPCARLPAAAARRVAAAPLARLVARPSAGGLRLGVRRTAALVLRAADTDASGYESANDDNVQSGKGACLRQSAAPRLSDGCATELAGAQRLLALAALSRTRLGVHSEGCLPHDCGGAAG